MTRLSSWGPGIERAIQRVIAGMCLFYAVSASLWAAADLTTASRASVVLLVLGVVVLVVTSARAWRTRITVTDLVATNVAMVLTLVVNAEIGTAGIGIQAGPAYVFMTTSLLVAALTQPWSAFWRWAALTTSVYVVGRYLGGSTDDLWAGLDEVVSDTSTIAAAGLILTFYRRAGRRADEAARARLESGRREALAAAAEHAAAEERRLLHDEIIAALVSIEHCGATRAGRRAADLARRARGCLRPELAPARADGLPRSIVDATGRHVPVAVTVDPALAGSAEVPSEVTVAITGAIGEALRNVERHAQARRVSVTIAPHDPVGRRGIRVTVADDGQGLGPDHAAGFGIRQSIEGRLVALGGTAEVRAGADGGTVVELSWTQDDDQRPVPPADAVSAIGNTRRFVYLVTVVATAGQLWLVPRHLRDAAEIGVAASFCTLIAAVAWLVPRRRIDAWTATAIFLVDAALLAWGLALAGDGALLDFRSWVVELSCVVIFTLTFFVRFRAMVALSLLLLGVIAAWTVHDPTITIGQVTDPLLQPLFYAVALGATAWGFRTVSLDIADQERAAARQVELEASHAAAASRSDERFEHLRAQLDPFLEAVETGAIDVSEPEVADRARALALLVRDEMYLPGLLDDDLRLLLATARESGTSITIRPSETIDGADAVGRLLKEAIDPTTVHSATLSLPAPAAPYLRLVILPAADSSTVGRLTASLDPIGAVIDSVEHATVITVPVSPRGAPGREPS